MYQGARFVQLQLAVIRQRNGGAAVRAADDPVAHVNRRAGRGRYDGTAALDMHVAGERSDRARRRRLRHRSSGGAKRKPEYKRYN